MGPATTSLCGHASQLGLVELPTYDAILLRDPHIAHADHTPTDPDKGSRSRTLYMLSPRVTPMNHHTTHLSPHITDIAVTPESQLGAPQRGVVTTVALHSTHTPSPKTQGNHKIITSHHRTGRNFCTKDIIPANSSNIDTGTHRSVSKNIKHPAPPPILPCPPKCPKKPPLLNLFIV